MFGDWRNDKINHILYSEYECLRSGRRYRVPKCKLNHFKNSNFPMETIKVLYCVLYPIVQENR